MLKQRIPMIIVLMIFAFIQLSGHSEEDFSSRSPQDQIIESAINETDETKKIGFPKKFFALDFHKYQALIEERLCSIEVIEEEGSLEIHFYDSNRETCDRYEMNRLSSVDMNQVADSTIPLFLKRRDGLIPSREEEPVGLIQVADLINLVLQKEKPYEEVLVYPVGQQKNKVENL